jgi:xanthine/uracil permease
MSSATPSSTVHPVDRVLPVRQMLTLGLQHMAVSYIGAIAVPLIVASALKCPTPIPWC